ncbi:MAG: hypothetical protein A2284_01810, partial [Deltaproteobacteria bacterium RIFOXYA12_FULL_61_11]
MAVRRYLISVDLEGVTGVATRHFADTTGKRYELAVAYLHSDLNAVIEGLLAADPTAEVLVRDAHCNADNLDLRLLHPRASLIQGWGTGLYMVEGISPEVTAVLLVGYHAGGHSGTAVLAHTFSGHLREVRVGGRTIDEAGLAGLHAGHFEVPVIFLAGDDQAVAAARECFPGLTGVAVKRSLARDCSASLSLREAS